MRELVPGDTHRGGAVRLICSFQDTETPDVATRRSGVQYCLGWVPVLLAHGCANRDFSGEKG